VTEGVIARFAGSRIEGRIEYSNAMPMEAQPLAAPNGSGGGSGITQLDPTSLADKATAAALALPGVSGFSVTKNPGAPNPGSVLANPGMPSPYSALQGLGDAFAQLQASLGGASAAAPGSGDLFAQRALQARLLGADGGSSATPQYYSGG
jgi:hypothetical protein